MAGSKKDWLENKYLQHDFVSDWAAVDPTYIALFTVAPTDSTDGTEVDTAVWTNYARVSVARGAGTWTLSGNSVTNTATIDFGTATVTGTAPVIVAFARCDAATAGNQMNWGDLTASKTIANGYPVSFPASTLTFTES